MVTEKKQLQIEKISLENEKSLMLIGLDVKLREASEEKRQLESKLKVAKRQLKFGNAKRDSVFILPPINIKIDPDSDSEK